MNHDNFINSILNGQLEKRVKSLYDCSRLADISQLLDETIVSVEKKQKEFIMLHNIGRASNIENDRAFSLLSKKEMEEYANNRKVIECGRRLLKKVDNRIITLDVDFGLNFDAQNISKSRRW